MTELELIKNYLRLDDDIEDDEQLNDLILAGKRYIVTSTGKIYKDDDHLMLMCLKLLVSFWYSNRTIFGKSGYTEAPHSVTALLQHIQISSDYEEAEDLFL